MEEKNELRNNFLHVRMTASEKKAIRKAMSHYGYRSLTSYVLDRLTDTNETFVKKEAVALKKKV